MTTEPPVKLSAPPHRLLRGVNSPLRVRFHVLMVILAIVAVMAVWFEGVSERNALRIHEGREYQDRASATAMGVLAKLSTAQSRLAAADDLVVHGYDLRNLCDVMGHPAGREYQRLYAFNPSGELRCSTAPGVPDPPEAVAQRPYFQSAIATGENQVSGPLVEAASSRLSVLVAHPLRSGSQTVGIVVAAIDAAALFDPAELATGSERELVFGRDGGWFEVGSLATTSAPFGVSGAAARSVATGEPCPVTVVGTAAWTCSPLGRSGLVLVTGHPEASVFATVSDAAARVRYRILGVIAFAIAVCFLGDFLFLRRIRLVFGSAGLAPLTAGDTARHDEIDALASWVRATEQTLHGLRSEVRGYERGKRDAEHDLLTSIAETVEIRYPFLRNHGDRVGRYVRQIGTRLGFSDDDLEQLEFAARVHDLGKIAIADAVYLKPGRLDPIEAAQMQLHASRGGEIAGRMRNVPPEVAKAIRHHHERWDGMGYPDGLAGTNIPLWSRVIAVADSYDAMTEERPYRQQPLTHNEALDVLRDGAGSQWDATAVQAFLDVVQSGMVAPKPISMFSLRVASDG